jgi:hypothetical protein
MTMSYVKIVLQSGSGRTAKRSIAHLQMQEVEKRLGTAMGVLGSRGGKLP